MEPFPEITRKMFIPSEMTLKETGKKTNQSNAFFQPQKTQVLRFFNRRVFIIEAVEGVNIHLPEFIMHYEIKTKRRTYEQEYDHAGKGF